MPYLLQIDRAQTGCCARCRSTIEVEGYVLTDMTGATGFFCIDCLTAMLLGFLPAAREGRPRQPAEASA